MIVTLLTDFGTADHYVAAMKGVILSAAPGAALVDISHEVPPQDIRTAAYLLGACHHEFPPGTTHLVVVDPGVGSTRRAIASRLRDQTFVGPDNGVFSFVWDSSPTPEVRRIERHVPGMRGGGATFHGRDLFAPMAAALAVGLSFELVGSPVADPIRLEIPRAQLSGRGALEGEIIHVDRYGNCVTNLPNASVPVGDRDRVEIRVGPTRIGGLKPFYAAGEEGAPFAIEGSVGYLEISVRNGSAARMLGIERGTRVTMKSG